MTGAILGKSVQDIDRDIDRQGRKACLLLVNCFARAVEDTDLENVELKLLPSNITSVIKLLYKGVIQSLKCAYHKRLIQKLLLNVRLGRETKINMFMALQMIASWSPTGSVVVANCFRHAGFNLQCAETSDSAINGRDDDGDHDENELMDKVAVTWADLQERGVPATSISASSCKPTPARWCRRN